MAPIEERVRTVSDAVQLFAESAGDHDRLLVVIAERMASVFGNTCTVQLVADDGARLVAAAIGADDPAVAARIRELLAAAPIRIDEHALYRDVIRGGTSLLVPVIDRDVHRTQASPPHARFTDELRFHSGLIVPLRSRGLTIGALSLGRYQPARPPFDERDLALAQTLATHAALAVEHARLFRSLQRQEARLATILDSIGDAVIATDASGRVERMNPVAEQLTGWPRDAGAGQPLDEVFPTDEIAGSRHRTLRTRTGATLAIAAREAPIRGAAAERHGTVVVFGDATEEIRAEENRRGAEANRIKAQFLTDMSHELRAPLNSMLGFGDLLRDEIPGPLNEQQREYLGYMLASSRHLLRLVDEVLDLAKLEAGKMRFRPVAIDPRIVVTDVARSFDATARAKGLTLTCDVKDAPTDVVVDPTRLKQVLFNLVSNAIKFTPPDGTVAIRMRGEGDAAYRVEVEDSGIGIAAADVPRLFTEFQQLGAAVRRAEGGTGLGLALTRRLVEAQGGTIDVRSEPGVGSVFHVVLPVAYSRAP